MAGRVQFRPGAKVERIQKRLDEPTRALKQVGALMVAESQGSFRQQKFGKVGWKPRAPINVYGLIADFAGGANRPEKRRFERRPALRDTGRLASSISFRLVGTNTVEVGTTVKYAAVHQAGGEVESEKITKDVQERLWEWLKTSQGSRYKSKLGWLLNKQFTDTKLTGEVPARPFIGITARTRDYVRRAVGAEIMEVG